MISSASARPQADRVAEAISLLFHPLLVVIPTMIIAIVQSGYTLLQAGGWTLLAAGVVNLPMALLIAYGVRAGHYSDASVSVREQRTSIYAVGGVTLLVLLGILIVAGAPVVLTACLVAALLATILGYGINRYTKLSLHSAAMAGCAAVLWLTTPVIGLTLAAFMPLVGWARIRLKHHTPAQILIGWAAPALCVWLVFRVMLV
jgi:membrane-associated phospholipid phosphatase